ncbi:MAG TPA: YgiQ family radical SAM protein, partial [Marinilabiliaceae bacterium]|nr:YgiQ family radical SAM protein [Marinilabiliaceae bacterium]
MLLDNNRNINDWLPVSVKEMQQREWEQADVVLFSGDAYVDHPAFANAVIGRTLEAMGLRVAIVPQPNWQDDLRDFKKFAKPRLFFGVAAGNMDSMVNHYTANRRLRSDDAYTPGGKAGFRPDYASAVYSKILKSIYPDVPVILGGIEASLRRLTHYDYWQDCLKPGILEWSQADMLVYGMGEAPLREIVRLLNRGVPFSQLNNIRQTAVLQSADSALPGNGKWKSIELYSHEECLEDKKKYAMNFRHIEEQSNSLDAAQLTQVCGKSRIVVNPPFPPMKSKDLDASYDLPYTRLPHPKYHKKGIIPAYEMIKHSINLHRGCFGGCSFCTISAHQGKFISSRSSNSILKEALQVSQMKDFKGYISDLGGPSANMYQMSGR